MVMVVVLCWLGSWVSGEWDVVFICSGLVFVVNFFFGSLMGNLILFVSNDV